MTEQAHIEEVRSFVTDYVTLLRSRYYISPLMRSTGLSPLDISAPTSVFQVAMKGLYEGLESSKSLQGALQELDQLRKDQAEELARVPFRWTVFSIAMFFGTVLLQTGFYYWFCTSYIDLLGWGAREDWRVVSLLMSLPLVSSGLALVSNVLQTVLFSVCLIVSFYNVELLRWGADWSFHWTDRTTWTWTHWLDYTGSARSKLDSFYTNAARWMGWKTAVTLGVEDCEVRCKSTLRAWSVRLVLKKMRECIARGEAQQGEALGIMDGLESLRAEEAALGRNPAVDSGSLSVLLASGKGHIPGGDEAGAFLALPCIEQTEREADRTRKATAKVMITSGTVAAVISDYAWTRQHTPAIESGYVLFTGGPTSSNKTVRDVLQSSGWLLRDESDVIIEFSLDVEEIERREAERLHRKREGQEQERRDREARNEREREEERRRHQERRVREKAEAAKKTQLEKEKADFDRRSREKESRILAEKQARLAAEEAEQQRREEEEKRALNRAQAEAKRLKREMVKKVEGKAREQEKQRKMEEVDRQQAEAQAERERRKQEKQRKAEEARRQKAAAKAEEERKKQLAAGVTVRKTIIQRRTEGSTALASIKDEVVRARNGIEEIQSVVLLAQGWCKPVIQESMARAMVTLEKAQDNERSARRINQQLHEADLDAMPYASLVTDATRTVGLISDLVCLEPIAKQYQAVVEANLCQAKRHLSAWKGELATREAREAAEVAEKRAREARVSELILILGGHDILSFELQAAMEEAHSDFEGHSPSLDAAIAQAEERLHDAVECEAASDALQQDSNSSSDNLEGLEGRIAFLEQVKGRHADLEEYEEAAAVKKEIEQLKLRRQEILEAEALLAEAAPEANAGGGECVVCLNAGQTHILIPCGHICVCDACIGVGDSCPMCSRQVSQKVQAFRVG